jgi:hypothetical protein
VQELENEEREGKWTRKIRTEKMLNIKGRRLIEK